MAAGIRTAQLTDDDTEPTSTDEEIDAALSRQGDAVRRRSRREMSSTVTAIVSLVLTVSVVIAFGIYLVTQSDAKASSERQDCRAVITAARRDVLDVLDRRLKVDNARQGQILGDALLGSLSGERPTQEDIAEYGRNNADLTNDLALNDELAPALPDAEKIVREGGTLPVIREDGTVGSRRFDPCPTV